MWKYQWPLVYCIILYCSWGVVRLYSFIPLFYADVLNGILSSAVFLIICRWILEVVVMHECDCANRTQRPFRGRPFQSVYRIVISLVWLKLAVERRPHFSFPSWSGSKLCLNWSGNKSAFVGSFLYELYPDKYFCAYIEWSDAWINRVLLLCCAKSGGGCSRHDDMVTNWMMWVLAFTMITQADPEVEGENFTLAQVLFGMTSVWPLPFEVM